MKEKKEKKEGRKKARKKERMEGESSDFFCYNL